MTQVCVEWSVLSSRQIPHLFLFDSCITSTDPSLNRLDDSPIVLVSIDMNPLTTCNFSYLWILSYILFEIMNHENFSTELSGGIAVEFL